MASYKTKQKKIGRIIPDLQKDVNHLMRVGISHPTLRSRKIMAYVQARGL